MRDRAEWRQFMLPIGLYLTLATLYLFAIPPGESPDEPSHLQCIEQVTDYNRIPTIDPRPRGQIWWARERIISGLVCAHMPLYYIVSGHTQRLVQTLSGVPAHYEFPANNPAWATGQSPAMFEHPAKSSFFSLSEPISLTVLRLESMLLGLVTLLAAYRVVRYIAPQSREGPQLAMILVAGWPQFLFMSRAINNDTLAIALSIAVLVVLLDVGRPNRFILASLLSTLATLSKITMAFTAVAVAITFVLELVTRREHSHYLRAAVFGLLVFGALVTLLLLEPTLRSHLEWTLTQVTTGGNQSITNRTGYWSDVLNLTLISGWARFGWMNVIIPEWQAYVWWLMLGLTGLGGLYAIFRTRVQATRFTVLICMIWLAGVFAVYVNINLNRFQPQFRYSFASIPVLAAFAAVGIQALMLRQERLKPLISVPAAIVLLIANLWIIFAIVVPVYA